MVVKRFHGCWTSGVDEVCLEIIKALDIVGAVIPLQHHVDSRVSVSVTSGIFMNGDWRLCSIYSRTILFRLPGKVDTVTLKKKVQLKDKPQI